MITGQLYMNGISCQGRWLLVGTVSDSIVVVCGGGGVDLIDCWSMSSHFCLSLLYAIWRPVGHNVVSRCRAQVYWQMCVSVCWRVFRTCVRVGNYHPVPKWFTQNFYWATVEMDQLVWQDWAAACLLLLRNRRPQHWSSLLKGLIQGSVVSIDLSALLVFPLENYITLPILTFKLLYGSLLYRFVWTPVITAALGR